MITHVGTSPGGRKAIRSSHSRNGFNMADLQNEQLLEDVLWEQEIFQENHVKNGKLTIVGEGKQTRPQL